MIKARGEARRISLIILSLTFFGALLRLYKLGVPLNGDEIPAFTWFTLIHWKTLLFSYYDPNQHTLFVILARLFMSSLGENEVTFRLPVFIAGVLSVPLIYNICSDYLRSRQTGLIAALLLSVSFYPIYYSQHGRSYSLTIFLALSTILVTTKLSNNTRLWFWGTLLPLLGFFLILALPSNLYFIFATPVFFLILSRQNKNGYRETLKCFFKREFFPFLVMFLLVFLYIFKIFPDIQRAIGIANSFGYHNGGNEISLTKLYHVFKYLLEPWGLWIYPFLLFGILQLKKQGQLSGLIIFFLVPLILIFAQGIIGPPRVYLFWHPLFLIICSAGVVNVFALIKGFKVQNKIVLAVLIITILLLGPAFRLEAYYRNQENLRGGITIAEAQKFSRSMERDDKHNRLFFVKSEILNRYIGSRIFKNNFESLRYGKIKEVIFLVDRRTNQNNMFWIRTGGINLPSSFMEKFKEIGNIIFYRFSGALLELKSSKNYSGYEISLSGIDKKQFKTEALDSPNFFGNKVLQIKSDLKDLMKNNLDIVHPEKFKIDGQSGKTFVLVVYAKKLKQNSIVGFKVDPNGSFVNRIFLGEYNNIFSHSGSNPVWIPPPPFLFVHEMMGVGIGRPSFFWDMKYDLYPLVTGENDLHLTFRIVDQISYFDGLKIFILKIS